MEGICAPAMQGAVADRSPQAVLDLGAERARAVAADVEQQFNWSRIFGQEWIWTLHQ